MNNHPIKFYYQSNPPTYERKQRKKDRERRRRDRCNQKKIRSKVTKKDEQREALLIF